MKNNTATASQITPATHPYIVRFSGRDYARGSFGLRYFRTQEEAERVAVLDGGELLEIGVTQNWTGKAEITLMPNTRTQRQQPGGADDGKTTL